MAHATDRDRAHNCPPVRCILIRKRSSALDGIPQNDYAVAEPAFLNKREIQSRTSWEESFSATDNNRAYVRLELVDKTGVYWLGMLSAVSQ